MLKSSIVIPAAGRLPSLNRVTVALPFSSISFTIYLCPALLNAITLLACGPASKPLGSAFGFATTLAYMLSSTWKPSYISPSISTPSSAVYEVSPKSSIQPTDLTRGPTVASGLNTCWSNDGIRVTSTPAFSISLYILSNSSLTSCFGLASCFLISAGTCFLPIISACSDQYFSSCSVISIPSALKASVITAFNFPVVLIVV